MKTFLIAATLAAATMSTAAHAAGEGRIEARGGIVWAFGASSETIGLAAGYDFDIGNQVFVGPEATIETDFNFGDPVLGINLRAGAKFGEAGKIFILGGYARTTGIDIDDAVVGIGAQQGIAKNVIFSVQYKRFIDLQINSATVGLGYRF